jgi:hypothetical protein
VTVGVPDFEHPHAVIDNVLPSDAKILQVAATVIDGATDGPGQDRQQNQSHCHMRSSGTAQFGQ